MTYNPPEGVTPGGALYGFNLRFVGLSWPFHVVTCVTEDAKKKITQDSVCCAVMIIFL